MNINISFFKEPTEVYEFIKQKEPQIHFDYDEIMHDTHKQVFTISKMTNLDLLKDMQKSLSEAYKKGIGFEEWKKDITPHLAKNGWLGNVKVTNPKTGEIKEIYVGSRRLKTIYNTNMRTAYAKARYNSQMNSIGNYFRYTAVMDNLTRASHAKLHGTILPKTDPFWDRNYPPNGWNCRCQVQVLTDSEISRYGYTPLSDSSFLQDIADKDFAYNPGKTDNIDDIFDKKAKRTLGAINKTAKTLLEPSVKNLNHERDLYIWQKSLDNMVDAILSGKIIKDKTYQIAQVGAISPNIKKALSKQGKTPKAENIAIYQNTISHITRDSKPKIKKPNINEIKAIVGVFDKAKHVFYDIDDNKLIYFYSSLQNDDMVNYVVVNLDFVLKKFGTQNFVATITKIPKKNYIGILRDKKRYKRIK